MFAQRVIDVPHVQPVALRALSTGISHSQRTLRPARPEAAICRTDVPAAAPSLRARQRGDEGAVRAERLPGPRVVEREDDRAPRQTQAVTQIRVLGNHNTRRGESFQSSVDVWRRHFEPHVVGTSFAARWIVDRMSEKDEFNFAVNRFHCFGCSAEEVLIPVVVLTDEHDSWTTRLAWRTSPRNRHSSGPRTTVSFLGSGSP